MTDNERSAGNVVSEKPILFSAEMVRAILAGRKRMTRRVVKLPGWFDISSFPREGCGLDGIGINADGMLDIQMQTAVDDCDVELFRCPYGKVGDRLWVRETWADTDHTINEQPGIVYRATDPDWESMVGWKWKPSIFMPRWASRITLEITGVRVDRLQEINEADALAEGIIKLPATGRFVIAKGGQYFGNSWRTAREAFQVLWDSINADREGCSWDENPWVWILKFKRLEQTR